MAPPAPEKNVLGRNLVIIVVLLVAIHFLWNYKKEQEERLQLESKQASEVQKIPKRAGATPATQEM